MGNRTSMYGGSGMADGTGMGLATEGREICSMLGKVMV